MSLDHAYNLVLMLIGWAIVGALAAMYVGEHLLGGPRAPDVLIGAVGGMAVGGLVFGIFEAPLWTDAPIPVRVDPGRPAVALPVRRGGHGFLGCAAQVVLVFMLLGSCLFFFPAVPFVVVAMIVVAMISRR